MHIACWIPKATNTLTICNTYCLLTATVVAHTRLDFTLYVYCLSCYGLNLLILKFLPLDIAPNPFHNRCMSVPYSQGLSLSCGAILA